MSKKALITTTLLLFLDQATKKNVLWQNLPHQQNSSLIFLIPSFIVISILIIWFKSSRDPGLLFILTGGLSNLLDRLILGYVIDWIYLPFFPFSVFNLADTYITLGLILAIFPTKNRL
jgi:lipoprotein signal peptidase